MKGAQRLDKRSGELCYKALPVEHDAQQAHAPPGRAVPLCVLVNLRALECTFERTSKGTLTVHLKVYRVHLRGG